MERSLQKAVCISVAAVIAVTGCAAPKKLEAIPVSPTQYAHLDCEQLNAEAQRVVARYVELGGKIDEDFKAEQALEPLLFVSVIVLPLNLLWLPFVPGRIKELEERGQREDEYRRLMGERNAILQAASEKGCPGVQLQPTTEKAASESSRPKPSDEQATVPAPAK